MKTTVKIFALATLILGFASTSFAQNNTNNAAATASGTIVTPITIEGTNMNFGTLIASEGTVTLVPGVATPTYSGVSAFTGSTPSTAQFTVSGSNSLSYGIAVTNLPTVVTLESGTATMGLSAWSISTAITATDFSTTGNGSGALNTSGTQSFEIGATLTVAAAQLAGTYTSNSFTVTVNYN